MDVSLEETFICVVDEAGETVWRGKRKSDPKSILPVVRKRAPQLVKMGFEAGPLSTWFWHEFTQMGLPAVCLDARQAKAALSMQVNKTDANDAMGLAQIVRTGWYREVRVKSMESHVVRSLLAVRSQLVGMHTRLCNQLRGILKTFGLVVGKVRGRGFEARVLELCAGRVELQGVIDSSLAVIDAIDDQLAALDRTLSGFARESEVCRLMMTVPGVGPVTAAAFMAAVDDPHRFRRSSDVGAYFGLTPRRYQSGEVDRSGRISKCGDKRVRSYLYEAAGVLLTRVGKWSKLKAWGIRLAVRVGLRKAKVAVARKLAVILYRIWTDGREFQWGKAPSA
ncbi:MAG: IS110 family transposase [Pseudomonadota bacterium]